MDFSKTWHTCWPGDKDVSYLLFNSGGKCVAMVIVPSFVHAPVYKMLTLGFFPTLIVIVSLCFHRFQ